MNTIVIKANLRRGFFKKLVEQIKPDRNWIIKHYLDNDGYWETNVYFSGGEKSGIFRSKTMLCRTQGTTTLTSEYGDLLRIYRGLL